MWDVKYRPLRFDEVLGQAGAIQVLKARLSKGTALDTSYIFSGGHGQGKTTLARILGRAILCQDLQEGGEPCNECDNCKAVLGETTMAFVELDAASRGTIDNIRGIVDDLPFAVPGAVKRVYLFDEAHRMGIGAQDVLLKPIEDKIMVAILCTTEPEKIRGPIRSRCEEHTIRKITREDILVRMKWVLEREGVEGDEDAIMTIIDFCGGHVRDVLNKLEMVAQLGPVSIDAVRENLNLSVVSTYYEILLSLGNPSKAVVLTEQACDRVGAEGVHAGLAEAAMNAYRLKHGMFAEFVFVDRELAGKTYEMYGEKVIHLAEYFLRSNRPTKISLVCDVVRCSGGVPVSNAGAPVSNPPVLVSNVAPPPPAKAVEADPEAPASPPEPASPSPPKDASPAPAAPQAPSEPPQPAETKDANGLRPDGTGNLGSGDICAKTELDTNAIAEEYPRRRTSPAAAPEGVHTEGEASDILPTPQWRREFSEAWERGA